MGSKFVASNRFLVDAEKDGTITATREDSYNYYTTESMSYGANGCAFEIASAPKKSRKKGVSAQGKKDNYIYMVWNNKQGYKRVDLESKTNGGRVTALIEALENGKDGYICYTCSLIVSNKKSDTERYLPKSIFRYSDFIAVLKSINAIKPMYHNGELDGYGIQVTKKDLIPELEKIAVRHNPNAIYNSDLEIVGYME